MAISLGILTQHFQTNPFEESENPDFKNLDHLESLQPACFTESLCWLLNPSPHFQRHKTCVCVSLALFFCVSCPHLHPFGLSVIYVCLPHFNLSQLHQPAFFCVVPPRDASKHLRVYVLLDLLIFTVCCEPKASQSIIIFICGFV